MIFLTQLAELDLLQKSIAELACPQKQATILVPVPSDQRSLRFVNSSAPMQKGTNQAKIFPLLLSFSHVASKSLRQTDNAFLLCFK